MTRTRGRHTGAAEPVEAKRRQSGRIDGVVTVQSYQNDKSLPGLILLTRKFRKKKPK